MNCPAIGETMNTKTCTCLLVGVAASLNLAHAQSLSARSTHLAYTGGLGQSLDWTNFSDSFDDNNFAPAGNSQLVLDYHKSGTYLQSPWFADVTGGIYQEYTLNGPSSNFQSIHGQLDTLFNCASGGPGSGTLANDDNGNVLYLDFSVGPNGMNYAVSGDVAWHVSGPAVRHAEFRISKWNTSTNTWNQVWSSFLPIFSGHYDHTAFLSPGDYQIYAWSSGSSIPNDTTYTNNSFDFTNLDAVPEPATLGLFALAIPALLRRKRN